MATSSISSGEAPLPAFNPIRCRTRTFDFSRVYVVGIVNVTPDSFSDGGRFLSPNDAIDHALALVDQGADILDLGGESTRPRGRAYGKGSGPVDEQEELKRLLPVIAALAKRTDVPLCVDTHKAAVAEASLGEGAQIINDISGLRSDAGMASVVASAGCPVVLMHMRGTPATTNSLANYRNLLTEVHQELTESMEIAVAAGVSANQIILDPGLGFGKVTRHNLQLLRRLSFLRCLSGRPVLVGPSRKAFVGDVLGGAPVEQREWGTAGAVAAAVMSGADFVRVHDVAAMRDVVRVAEAVRRERPTEGEKA